MKGIGLSRVADAAGVSVATVSNTINRPHMVSETTRRRVEDAMRRLEFVPNRAAATLRDSAARPSTQDSSAASSVATKPGALAGAMPAKLSLNMRPVTAAGLAKLVLAVNQYAAPM